MKTLSCFIIMLNCVLANVTAQSHQQGTGFVTITFNNLVNQQRVVLNDSTYSNPFGESYVIKKLKYYVSNITFYSGGKPVTLKKNYWLINQSIDSSLSITMSIPESKYDSIGFLLGVDSARNNSGAQTGALDPLNDMFWTWHSGYIMEKLEGSSPQSNIVNNKFEYHIGGYAGAYNVLHFIQLPFPAGLQLAVKNENSCNIVVDVDIDKFWSAGYQLKITETPVCSATGPLAKKIAGNFSSIFSIASIIN